MGALIVEDRQRVRYLTLNRPDERNAMNSALLQYLSDQLQRVDEDSEVGAVVLRGAGERAFCAGADLKEISDSSFRDAKAFIDLGQSVCKQLQSVSVPTIAAVDGWALGGGMELALTCDMVLATDRSRFGLPEATIGCMPGFGGTQRIFASASKSRAMRILLTGAPVSSQEAFDIGILAQQPCSPAEFEEEVCELATTIAAGSREANRRILDAARVNFRHDGLEFEAALAAVAISSPEGREGIRSFMEHRKPRFRDV